MPDVNDVLTAIRDDLTAAGIIRKPRTAGVLPPLFLEPDGGAPAPGELEAPEDNYDTAKKTGLVVSLFASELGEAPLDRYRRRIIVDVRYRSKGTAGLKRGRDLDQALRARYVVRDGGRLGFTLAAGQASEVFVHDAQLWAGLGPISRTVDRGVDEVAKYLLEVDV